MDFKGTSTSFDAAAKTEELGEDLGYSWAETADGDQLLATFLVPDVRSDVVVNLLLLLHLASLQGVKVDFHRCDLHVANWKNKN